LDKEQKLPNHTSPSVNKRDEKVQIAETMRNQWLNTVPKGKILFDPIFSTQSMKNMEEWRLRAHRLPHSGRDTKISPIPRHPKS
jgi:hypothetical protein